MGMEHTEEKAVGARQVTLREPDATRSKFDLSCSETAGGQRKGTESH